MSRRGGGGELVMRLRSVNREQALENEQLRTALVNERDRADRAVAAAADAWRFAKSMAHARRTSPEHE